MSDAWKRRGWPVLKGLVALVILVAVGRQFYLDLRRPELTELSLRPGWLAVSGALYLLAQSFSAGFWLHLLRVFGERPRARTAFRAYYVSQFGKYVPGKAWALLLRGSLVRGPDVRFGVAILATFYEVLTTMAAGALVAAVVFVVDPPEVPGMAWPPLLTGLALLALCGVPLLPGVFNRVVGRLARRFASVDSLRVPQLRFGTLLVGLGLTAVGWGLLGLSLWATLKAVLPEPTPLDVATWLRCAGTIGLAYVAGFLAVFMPSGVGVREYFLLNLLRFAGPEGLVAAAVLLLRLAWTAAEVLLGTVLLGLRPPRSGLPAADVADEAVARVD
jgi:uncharacterized membrane protein YbhN (UPF0104 family)